MRHGNQIGQNQLFKSMLSFFLIMELLLAAAARPVRAESPDSAPRTRYEMELVLDDEQAALRGNVKVTVYNDSEDTWNELCFRDYMASVQKLDERDGSVLTRIAREAARRVEDLAERHARRSLNILRATQSGKKLDMRAEGRDQSVVYLWLEEPLKPGESTEVVLECEAKIPKGHYRCAYEALDYENTAARTYELAQFYPMLAVYEDGQWRTDEYITDGECMYSRVADYAVTFHAPEGFAVIASGNETRGETADGMTEWTIEAEAMRDVTIIASNEYAEPLTGEACGVTINSYYAMNQEKYNAGKDEDDGHAWQGAHTLQAAMDAVEAFTECYGPYPYDGLDIVESNYEYGGMEAPGLVRISQMYSWSFDDPEYQDKCAATTAHEVAHEWFYGVVGNDQFNEAWLDESFAAFSEQVYWRHMGRSETEIAAAMKPFIEEVPYSGVLYVDRAYSDLNNEYYCEYTSAVYRRGAGFLYQLEQSVGRETFYDFMRTYYAAFSFREAHTEDFVRTLLPFIEKNEAAKALVSKYLSRSQGLL